MGEKSCREIQRPRAIKKPTAAGFSSAIGFVHILYFYSSINYRLTTINYQLFHITSLIDWFIKFEGLAYTDKGLIALGLVN
jgi:hypothetical protein